MSRTMSRRTIARNPRAVRRKMCAAASRRGRGASPLCRRGCVRSVGGWAWGRARSLGALSGTWTRRGSGTAGCGVGVCSAKPSAFGFSVEVVVLGGEAGQLRNDSEVPAQCLDRSRDLLAGVGGSNWASIAFTRSFLVCWRRTAVLASNLTRASTSAPKRDRRRDKNFARSKAREDYSHGWGIRKGTRNSGRERELQICGARCEDRPKANLSD